MKRNNRRLEAQNHKIVAIIVLSAAEMIKHSMNETYFKILVVSTKIIPPFSRFAIDKGRRKVVPFGGTSNVLVQPAIAFGHVQVLLLFEEDLVC